MVQLCCSSSCDYLWPCVWSLGFAWLIKLAVTLVSQLYINSNLYYVDLSFISTKVSKIIVERKIHSGTIFLAQIPFKISFACVLKWFWLWSLSPFCSWLSSPPLLHYQDHRGPWPKRAQGRNEQTRHISRGQMADDQLAKFNFSHQVYTKEEES
jgi:hypothetical protein